MVVVSHTHSFDDSGLITLTEAKANLRVDHSLDDAEIQAMIYAAYQNVENHLNRVLLNSSITYNLQGGQDSFSMVITNLGVSKNYGDIIAIDSEGNEVATISRTINIDNDVITVSDIVLASSATVSSWNFTISYSPKLLNKVINTAVFLTITHFYENRNAVVVGVSSNELPMGVKSILSFYRYIPI